MDNEHDEEGYGCCDDSVDEPIIQPVGQLTTPKKENYETKKYVYRRIYLFDRDF